MFASKDLAEWRKILDGNGLVFGVVGILDDIPERQADARQRGAGALRERHHAHGVNSPILIDGAKKVQPRKPPDVGEHSDEILRQAGYDEAAIKTLRASGAVG